MSAPAPRTVTVAEVAARLAGESRALVVSHEAPDGDALGCVVAFLLTAERLGVDCRGYIPGETPFPSEYSLLPRLGEILRGAPPKIEAGTTVYLLDCASSMRSNSHEFGEGVTRVNIDHHQDNPGYGELNLLDGEAPSATAILYEILKAGGHAVELDIATALYVGLVTDTGRFQYSNTTPRAHRMAAELQEAGVDVNAVYRQVYETTPLAKMLLLQRTLCHLDMRLSGALAAAWLDAADFAAAGADESQSEGIIDSLRQIEGARVAALVRERRRDGRVECKVSLRSTDGVVNVAALAQRQGGGGHVRAAGFTTQMERVATLGWIEDQVASALSEDHEKPGGAGSRRPSDGGR